MQVIHAEKYYMAMLAHEIPPGQFVHPLICQPTSQLSSIIRHLPTSEDEVKSLNGCHRYPLRMSSEVNRNILPLCPRPTTHTRVVSDCIIMYYSAQSEYKHEPVFLLLLVFFRILKIYWKVHFMYQSSGFFQLVNTCERKVSVFMTAERKAELVIVF